MHTVLTKHLCFQNEATEQEEGGRGAPRGGGEQPGEFSDIFMKLVYLYYKLFFVNNSSLSSWGFQNCENLKLSSSKRTIMYISTEKEKEI